MGKEKPSNSPAAEQQLLLIVGLPVLSALTSRRRPDFTWQEVPLCLKSSKTSPGGKTKELHSWQRSGRGKLGSRGWLGRGMGKARRDVMVSRWASTSTLPPPIPDHRAARARAQHLEFFWSWRLQNRAGISETDPANLSDCFPRCWPCFSSCSSSTSLESQGCQRGCRRQTAARPRPFQSVEEPVKM